MAKETDKSRIAEKMFIESDDDDLKINAERSSERKKLREETGQIIVKRFNVKFINLADIVRRSESQVRAADFDPEKHEEDRQLLESIRNKGVVTPIMVKEIVIGDEDDPDAKVKYELIYGHRRTSACKVLGYTSIPAQIVDRRIDSDEVTMIENMGVRPLTAFERGREIDRYITKSGMSASEFARQNGFSVSRVSELIAAYRASLEAPEIQALYQEGRINAKNITQLVRLYSESDESTKALLLEKFPDMTVKQIKELFDFFSLGGSPKHYLQSLDAPAVSVTSDKEPEKENAEQKKPAEEPDLTALWEKLENSKSYLRKTSAVYGCQQKDVKEAAALCRDANLKPDAIRLVLSAKKNGRKMDEKLMGAVKTVMSNPDMEKSADLYFTAYEKAEERKKGLLKKIEDLDEENAKIVKSLIEK